MLKLGEAFICSIGHRLAIGVCDSSSSINRRIDTDWSRQELIRSYSMPGYSWHITRISIELLLAD